MTKYICPCSNVSIEESNITDAGTLYDRVCAVFKQTNFTATNTESLETFIEKNFLVDKSSFLEIKSLDQADSFVKKKYPLLTGSLSRNILKENFSVNLNVCLICDVATHCTLTYLVDNSQNVYANAAMSVTEKNPDSTSTLDFKTSSHSLIQENFSSILVNTKELLSNPDQSKFTEAENYSSVFDVVINQKKAIINYTRFFDEFKLRINQVPLFEQKIFINQIEEKTQTANLIDTSKEKLLKQRLQHLVNSYLTNDSHVETKKSSILSSSKLERKDFSGRQINNKIAKQSKVKYDENVLSTSVFEMEDIDESTENDKFSPDFNSDDADEDVNSQEEIDGLQFQNSILKKRNSNIGLGTNTSGIAVDSHKKNREKLSQYSCSLPREIPVLSNRRSSIKDTNPGQKQPQKFFENSENYYNPVKEQQKHHNQVLSNSYKHQNSNFLAYALNNTNQNDDVYDELFLDNDDKVDEEPFLDEDDTTNLGQAISSLASSIVVKDGRELFGGVPSRRVHINSISKSCYE